MRLHKAHCLKPGCDWSVRGDAATVEREAQDHSGDSRRKSRRRPGHPIVQSLTEEVDK